MRTAMRKAILANRVRSIRRELDNLYCLRSMARKREPLRIADEATVIRMFERENRLLRDLHRLTSVSVSGDN